MIQPFPRDLSNIACLNRLRTAAVNEIELALDKFMRL